MFYLPWPLATSKACIYLYINMHYVLGFIYMHRNLICDYIWGIKRQDRNTYSSIYNISADVLYVGLYLILGIIGFDRNTPSFWEILKLFVIPY